MRPETRIIDPVAVDDIFGTDVINHKAKLGKGGEGAPAPGEGTPEGEGGEGDGDGKSWAEMVEDDHLSDGQKQKVEDLSEKFSAAIKEAMKEGGENGVKNLLFALELAAEGLVRDFKDGIFVDFDAVREEDIYRLRRVAGEMKQQGGV